MDAVFAQLQKEGKTDVESLIKWMKDSKVIDATKGHEEKARGFFSTLRDQANVTLEQFKEVVGKLAAELKTNVDSLSKQLAGTAPAVQSMVDGAATKVIDKTKEQEEKVRNYFNEVADKKDVTLDKFKEIIAKVAEEFKTNLEGVTKLLEDQGPKLVQSLAGGTCSTLTGFMKDLVGKK